MRAALQIALIACGALALLAGCQRQAGPDTRLPDVSSKQYLDTVSAFNIGLAALQIGDDLTADARLAETTRLAPGEPAGWADWAVLALRQQHFDAARERLRRALDLDPKSDHLFQLLGLLEAGAGRPADAIASLRRAAELNPADLRTTFALAQQVERQGGEGSDAEVARLIEAILSKQPGNLAAQLELARISARRGDAAALNAALGKVAAQAAAPSSGWPAEAREQLGGLQAIASAGDLRAAGARTTILRNVLLRVPQYRKDRDALKATPGEEARPFTAFVRLAAPKVVPSPADASLAFDVRPIASLAGAGRRWSWAGAIQLGDAGPPVAAAADGRQLRLANGTTMDFPGGAAGTAPSPEGVLQADLNYDFKTDLVLAGEGGVRLYRQDSADRFSDVTARTKLPRSVIDGRYTGAWAVDIEADGDLDIVLGSTQGAPLVLRNNGDGSFAAIHPFDGISGLRQLAWADIDGDGSPDATLIDAAGQAHFFVNERQGRFRERALPTGLGALAAIAVADARNDGGLELVAVRADGSIVRIADRNNGQDWELVPIASVAPASELLSRELRLRAADLDNNGAIDLILSPVAPKAGAGAGTRIWLGSAQGGFLAPAGAAGPAATFDAADLRGDGRLDLIGLSDTGEPVSAVSHGSTRYHWQVVRPRAAQAFGDQRINPFGVGGEAEIRAGLLVQKQPISGPQVHFGLGAHEGTDVARVIWPNGAARAEFVVGPDQAIVAEQRLKGSCPFYFAFDGKAMQFVKDGAPWGSAIGLRINTIGTAAIAATEEWYRIGRDQLVPRDGYYDLRVTAELWEVYYYDYLALMAVDHPAGTEIYVDESFVIPTPKLAITATEPPHDIVQAVDDEGHDVTGILRTLDGRGLANFGRGQYQGVTRDHYVEVDLGPGFADDGPVYLLAHGSIYPTDSSINVAMSQGGRWRAHGLSLEVPDGRGGWVVARDNLGFPAGRKKTMLIDLAGVFRPGTPHRLRLRTNLELFWDQIQWARGLPQAGLRTTRLAPAHADLHYRGYSQITRPDGASPELPDYQVITGSKQRWRDLIGYYTRFGDVRELLAGIDDRYVIMNSGDEMSLRFAEQPPPPPGWVRDFVVIGDGWIKDGDYNSTFGKTVQPLPYHAKRLYVDPPGRLEDEPAYRQHPGDWQAYHTRYVTPDGFVNALRQ